MIERIATYWDGRSASWRKERDEAWSRPETEQWLLFHSIKLSVSVQKTSDIEQF
ncbi:hypothetical protein [Sphingobacterium sp. GVS05A]|uniref:hypothetical protein n=1 Tax=Sphingobacterium sp. GVS05A TaxID=2862679 RepID=UPI001CBE3C52|nr:hypothetical protein [Sphingobacterium sp. GVS05A]